MDHIRSLLPKVLHKRGLQEHATAAQACWLAGEWLHKQLPALTDDIRVTKYVHRELHICTKHSIASQECQQLSAELQAHLAEVCPKLPVDNIRIIREK